MMRIHIEDHTSEGSPEPKYAFLFEGILRWCYRLSISISFVILLSSIYQEAAKDPLRIWVKFFCGSGFFAV
jgi:hypothetical protein